MAGDNIFYVLFVLNLEIKFSKKKDPMNESGFGLQYILTFILKNIMLFNPLFAL